MTLQTCSVMTLQLLNKLAFISPLLAQVASYIMHSACERSKRGGARTEQKPHLKFRSNSKHETQTHTKQSSSFQTFRIRQKC